MSGGPDPAQALRGARGPDPAQARWLARLAAPPQRGPNPRADRLRAEALRAAEEAAGTASSARSGLPSRTSAAFWLARDVVADAIQRGPLVASAAPEPRPNHLARGGWRFLFQRQRRIRYFRRLGAALRSYCREYGHGLRWGPGLGGAGPRRSAPAAEEAPEEAEEAQPEAEEAPDTQHLEPLPQAFALRRESYGVRDSPAAWHQAVTRLAAEAAEDAGDVVEDVLEDGLDTDGARVLVTRLVRSEGGRRVIAWALRLAVQLLLGLWRWGRGPAAGAAATALVLGRLNDGGNATSAVGAAGDAPRG